MSKTMLVLAASLAAAMIPALSAQDRLNLNIGGGISTPLNPTGAYTGIGGNFVVGAGYNLTKKSSLTAEYLWSGLPPDLTNFHPINAPTGSINLHSLTTNYRYHIGSIHGSIFGLYAIGGGGWYYRYATIDKNYTVAPNTVCAPYYIWWGYACDPNGYVYSQTVAARGISAGGLNGGIGFTIRFADSGLSFYTEARYHYAFSARVATTLIPVTFGFRYN